MMRIKRISFRFALCALCSMGLAASLTSCEEKDYNSYMPVFSGFAIDKDAPAPGDTLTIEACQASRGSLLNGTTYIWTITNSSGAEVLTKKEEVIYDHNPANPKVGYRVPADAEPGLYTVTFQATYRYSGNGVFLEYESPFNYGLGGTFGTCSGSTTFTVQNVQ